MELIKSLMGRRKFLATAAATSTAAITLRNLTKVTGVAMAAGRSAGVSKASDSPGTAGNFSNRYSHLLSPLKIGKAVLKNRMYSTNALPNTLQGPENFPSEELRSYCANLAKNGAAIITFRALQAVWGGSGHESFYDLENKGVQNYFNQLAEAVHCYGSKISYAITLSLPKEYKESSTPPGQEMSTEFMHQIIEETVNWTKYFQCHGFDMICLRDNFTPYMKNRTDQYGGSIKNAARFSIELYQAIKKACGQDFLIEGVITVVEASNGKEKKEEGNWNYSACYTLEEAIAFAKQWEGCLDILHIRVNGGIANYPTGFISEKNKPWSLRFAQAIKQSGTKIAIAPNGGFQDLDFNEECIATGKCDMIAMGRAFIADWEYGKKAYEGRGEDVTPCIMCNKCHGTTMSGDFYTVCSVNPKVGITPAVRLLEAPVSPKKVAVIGGGPAGMKAALVASERGHKVTLYEKNDYLGGQLRHTDFASFKWPYKDYKDYLISQIKKAGIELFLSTKATPAMIRAKGYDAVLVAVGSEPIIPNIPVADGSNVRAAVFAYGNEKALGKHVAVIGGGEIGDEEAIIGVETGMYLAKAGHKVMVLTSRKELMRNYRVHYLDQVIDCYEHLDNFSLITEVTATDISQGKVTYVDAKGNEKSIQADSVVISVGRQPRRDEALKFYGSANRFFMMGDCGDDGGNVQKCIRSAFFTASQI